MRKFVWARIGAVICALAMAVCVVCLFAACGKGDDPEESGNEGGNTLLKEWTDLAYADNPTSSQYLDMYLPSKAEGPFPLVIYIHGGGFTQNTKSYGLLRPLQNAIKSAGFAVACIDYTLSTVDSDSVLEESGYPQMVYDVKAAVRYIRANAELFRIDPDSIYLLGDSAGAHLALLAAATNGNSVYEDLAMGNVEYSSSVQGVISISGPSLYSFDDACTRSCLSVLVGEEYTEEEFEAVSPYFQATDKMPPTFLAHGQADDDVPVEQSYKMQEKLENLIGEDNVKTYYPENAGHVDFTEFNSDGFASMVTEFLNSCISSK